MNFAPSKVIKSAQSSQEINAHQSEDQQGINRNNSFPCLVKAKDVPKRTHLQCDTSEKVMVKEAFDKDPLSQRVENLIDKSGVAKKCKNSNKKIGVFQCTLQLLAIIFITLRNTNYCFDKIIKILKIIDLMETKKSNIHTISLTILHSSNHTFFQSYSLPILHSSNITLFQSYALPILHSYTLKIWQFYKLVSYTLHYTHITQYDNVDTKDPIGSKKLVSNIKASNWQFEFLWSFNINQFYTELS